MTFDVAGAKQAGYTDAEILGHLAPQSKFDTEGARRAGYNDAEILQFLGSAPAVSPQTTSQGPAPLSGGTSKIIAPPAAQPAPSEQAAPPSVVATKPTVKGGEPTAEELAIASKAYFGPKIKSSPPRVVPVVTKPEPQEPIIYKTRVEALDDAVNLLEMNHSLADVVKHFASLGVTQDEIESHAKARNSEYVQPKVPTAPSGRYSLTNAKLQKTPEVADEIERLVREGKSGEAGMVALKDEYKTYADAFRRAGANLRDQATSALTTIGAINPDEAAYLLRDNAIARARSAPSETVQKGMTEIGEAKTYGEVVEKMFEHPVATFTLVVDSALTSLPMLAPSLFLGPAGAGVRAALAFAGSGTSEYASTMTDVLQDHKIDLRDVEQVAKALRDPKILAEIKDKGAKRGLIVGAFDGITMGIAGRFLGPVRELIREGNLAGNAARKATIGAWSKEIALQMAGGAGGELAAQKAVGEDKKAAVVLETIAELPKSIPEVMSTFGKGPTPSETLGNALREQVARGSFTEEGIQNEVRNSLDPNRQQASNIPNRPTLEVPTNQPGTPVAKNEIPPEQPPEQKPTQTPVTSLNKQDEYVNEEDLFAPPPTGETPVVANFADRAAAAANSFESAVVEQFGLTPEQSKAALAKLMEVGLVELDPISGQFNLKTGDVWNTETMLRAAGVEKKPDEVIKTDEAPTSTPILQNRDRSSDASIKQMQGIAADPDYGRGGVGRDFANGAAVIAGGNIPIEQLGKKDFAVTAKGLRIPIQYAVVDADSILASNLVDGTVNKDYDDSNIKQSRAIAGNGRVAGLQEAYRIGTADNYKSELAQDDMHGVSPDAISKIANPVLVRIMSESDITSDIGDVSNIKSGLDLSPTEQAKNDINRVDLSKLEFDEKGNITPNAIRAFINAMPETELGTLLDGGIPSRQAYDRLDAAIFAKAYKNDKLISLFSQANDVEGKLLLSALAQVAPQMARLEGAGILDIRDIVVDGAIAILNAKSRGLSLKETALQADIEMSPSAQIIVELFAANPRSNKAAIAALRDAANFAYQQTIAPTTDMFGEVQRATREDVLNKIREGYERPIAQNVGTTEGTGPVQANAEGPPSQPSATGIPGKNEESGAADQAPLTLTSESQADIEAREKQEKASAVEAGAEAKRIEEEERAETVRKEIAARSEGQVLELTPSEQVDSKAQEEKDRKEAETKLAGQKDIFGDKQQSMAGAVGSTTKEQKNAANIHAEIMGAEVVWQQGDYSLIRGYSMLSGDPVYMPTFGSLRLSKDISAVQWTRIPNDIQQKMLDEKAKNEAAADKLHKTKPFIKFDAGIATSENVSPELAGVLREWKNLLNIQSDIYISTIEDAKKNKNKFTGPHRRVGSGTLGNALGNTRLMADGSTYILFTESTSKTKMLEILAHELGHIHERTHFYNASPQERTALFDEHKKWLSQQKGKTAEELVKALRARSTGRATTMSPGTMADTIPNPYYWKSFGEWYADQTAKWAVSSKAPVGIVEKYFKRLGQALRIFFQNLKAQKYLPTETFSKYMEAVTSRPANLQPMVSSSEAQSMKADVDIVKKYNRADVPDANNTTIKETVLKAAPKIKDVFIEATLHPITTTTSVLVGMDRALLGARNREIFFASALNAADIARYGGQLRTSAGLATASLALDNAIRGNIIATQVIFQGGLVYDSKTMTYRAEKTKLGMHGVYREEAKLKKKLGKKLGMQIIQGYLEAKRSQSILDELEARELEVQTQRQAVAAMTNKVGVTPAVLAKATANLKDAEAGLTAIKRVEKKINMSPDEITEFLDREKDHPELRNIMDNFNAINQNLLSFWLDVGLLSKGRYDVLSKIQDYVPWHRIMEDDVNPENTEPTSPMLSSTRSMTNIGREKIMRDGKPEVKETFKVKTGQRIFKVKPSSDVFVEINGQALPSGAYRFTSDGTVTINSLIPLSVGDRVVITTNREIENMIDNMTRSVMRMTLNGLRHQAARKTVSEYADRDEKGRIIVYTKAGRTKESNRFSYIANGKPIIVGIEDKLISDAIYGLDTVSLTSNNLMSAASNFIRRSITLSGAFQVKQVFKDAPQAAMVIKPKSPYLLVGGVYKGFVTATLRPIVNSIGKKFNSNFDIEPVVEVLLKNGIGGFHSAARTPEKEIKINLGIMNNTVAGYALKFLDHIGDSSDVAQRVAVYKRVLKETGDEAQALYHAANVINFLHRGYGVEAQFLVKNVAFIGAWANSLDVLAQSMAGGGFKLSQKNKDPKGRLASQAQFLATAAKLSAGILAYCFLVGDDDDYRKMDDKSKYYNLMIPGTKIMLPMNTTAGFIFKMLPEAMYNHYINSSASTPHDRTRLATSLRHAFLDMIAGPDPIPSGIKIILETAIDYNFLTGKPITPVSLKKDIAEEQYTGSTSELGKAISGLTGNKAIFGDKRLLNPIEADHIVRSLFGSIGSTVMWASNLMGEAALIRPTMTDKQTPLLGPFMRNEVGRNREDLFYDLKERVEQKVQTLSTKESRDKNTDEFERKHDNLLSFQKDIAKTQKTLDAINKEIREFETSVIKGPSPDTRAREIILLQKEKNDVLLGIEMDRVEAGL
jgi:hypothetical protein